VAGDPTIGAPFGRHEGNGVRRPGMRQAVALALAMTAIAALVFASGSATADPSISSKRQQAQAILEQVQGLDSELGHAIESYNLANIQLSSIDADLKSNGRHLVIAKQSLGIAQVHIAKRLRALYINGDSGGTVEVILGAKSLDDLLDRLDIAQRVGGQDAQVLSEVRQFGTEVKTRRTKLRNDRARQAQVVADRAAKKQWIEGKLAERRQLLSSIQGEIKRMQEAEARRQAILAAQARARLAATRSEASQPQALQYTPPVADSSAPEAPVPSSQYGGVVGIAMQYLGTPYVWGGASPGGFDCSGFVMYVYAQEGVSVPHNAAMQYNTVGSYVPRDQLQPGDLVFFDGLGHVGIYIGGGQFIHAPHTGDVVKISSLCDSWYASTYVGAKRV
jgi:cell wall-associated NlpC family hydrolase